MSCCSSDSECVDIASSECVVGVAGEGIALGFQHYVLSLGTAVMIPTMLVQLMGGNDVRLRSLNVFVRLRSLNVFLCRSDIQCIRWQ